MLAPPLLQLPEQTKLAATLLLFCRRFLQQRVDQQPQPPANWSREVPATKYYQKQWQLLRTFFESPDQKVFDYRIAQKERSEMENAIQNVEIDLRMETIKKGTPHTLRITKTQAAYQKELKKWEEERVLLSKVVQKEEDGAAR